MQDRTCSAAQSPRAGERVRSSCARTPIELLGEHPMVAPIASACQREAIVSVRGSIGSSTPLLCGTLHASLDRPVLLVVAHIDEADHALDELRSMGVDATLFPAQEMLPGESGLSAELTSARWRVLDLLSKQEQIPVLIAPIQALMQPADSPETIASRLRKLTRDDEVDPASIIRWLTDAGYERVETIEEPGQFAVRGGIVDVFQTGDEQGASAPIRLDFFGNSLETIHEIALDTMGSDRAVGSVELRAASVELPNADTGVCLAEICDPATLVVLHETLELQEQARGYYERVHSGGAIYGPPHVLKLLRERFDTLLEINQFSPGAATASSRYELPVEPLPAFDTNSSGAIDELLEIAAGARVVVTTENDGEAERFEELLADRADSKQIRHSRAYVHRGFQLHWPADDPPLVLVPYNELLGRYQTRRRTTRVGSSRAIDTFLDVQPGDLVVHLDHGIARFVGLTTMKARSDTTRTKRVATEHEEFLTLEFAKKAKLHVPATQIDCVQKYIGGFSSKPKLSTLGGKLWKHQKSKVAEATRDLAAELLRVQATRESMPGTRFPGDTKWQNEFDAEFPYVETEDQLTAIAQVANDMARTQPMDRLICGDVGFGKTEIAMRAAFKAAEFGKQVAVLVPTTVLAEQHERSFRSRFAGYPFRIDSLSRFKHASEVRDTLEAVAKGRVDILIGTHRILSKDVGFADLGLVIVDEEQRFGVEHKQTLLSLRATLDVLTLSATPIPRTLHMSMLGLRDISSLTTPPVDRRAIVTEVLPFNEQRIKRALERELAREGQVFFVHNRVRSIRAVADRVRAMVPDARIVVGHGQMPPSELEKVMLTFLRGDADILVSTTIIESGIDIPTANTMIITDADRFGLAELHQLRGRVGRSRHRAYCYLLLPESRIVNETAKRRLHAIEEYSMLGAGFRIAMRDLEIRGAGNLLGAEQSGHIATVGYELYCRMLEEAARELRNEPTHTPLQTSIELGIVGVIPKPYIPSDTRRMEAYRRISSARTLIELDSLEQDLTSAYGALPETTDRLLDLSRLRVALSTIEVSSVTIHGRDIVFHCPDPEPIRSALDESPGTVRPLTPASPGAPWEVYFRPPETYLEPGTLLSVMRQRFVVPLVEC
ncbi:MAG: transcription-repair coupling factor [Planctomycetota bacterium]|jgi:transcription-repair coupling factor (superfamily II helicase)